MDVYHNAISPPSVRLRFGLAVDGFSFVSRVVSALRFKCFSSNGLVIKDTTTIAMIDTNDPSVAHANGLTA